MIYTVLKDLKEKMESKINISIYLNYLPTKDMGHQIQADGIYITLLNINEEVSAKVPYFNHQNNQKKYSKQNTPIALDLYIMISAYYADYTESLKGISKAIQFFANKNDFAKADFKYSLNLYNISLDQNNNLWQALSSNVLPHVIYKLRTVIITPEINASTEVTSEVTGITLKTTAQ